MKRLNHARTLLLAITATLTLSASLSADVLVPNIFSDHMVLQQKQQNKIWGKADAGEKVIVTIGDQKHETAAGDDGMWSVMLEALPVGGPHELVIKGTNEIKISDVLVGEVWICSGQSNMAWKVNNSNDADLEKLTAKYPKIRMINFPQVGTQEPVWEHKNSQWLECTPENVGNYSAVGYFFGRQLHETLDIPIGLINNAWGGSACEAWINRDVLEEDGRFTQLLDRWEGNEAKYEELVALDNPTEAQKKSIANFNRQMTGNQRPSNIYNGVLKSHLGYGIQGAIWYQGESNASRAYQYRELFPLMIQNWRNEWKEGNFPFYWVQLADFRDEKPEPAESDWAELREAQTMTAKTLPHTGEAVIIDIGEGKDIHPRNKVDVGRRLARLALKNEYGLDIAANSPTFKSMEKQDGKIILTFDNVHGGWDTFDVRNPVGFAIAGEDKKFVWAEAKILKDNRIEVSSPDVANPESVRYAWADNPVCNMFDNAGLPLTPFRTDEWAGVTANNR